jgi:hypothetical protein
VSKVTELSVSVGAQEQGAEMFAPAPFAFGEAANDEFLLWA